MKFQILFLILFPLLILQSCSSGNDKTKNNPSNLQKEDSLLPKEKFATGQIIEKVVCKNDASQNYSMYLPSTYSTEKTYPVIYAFDAHGNGKIPVSIYKELAEKHGFLIIGSNNSKNGNSWEESKVISDKLFEDVRNRLSINTKRTYLLGFSGGARVANGIAITNGGITGVICCGAALPATNSDHPRTDYFFIGIVGTEDFNYTEFRKYHKVDLAGKKIKHTLITFDGKHEWPPIETMDEAWWWLELNEMRINMVSKNDSLIAQHFQPLLKKMKELQTKKQEFEAYNFCRQTINFYDGLVDLTYFIEAYKALQKNEEVDRQLKLEEASWDKEEKLKQYYTEAFQQQNFAWWKKEIADVNKKIKTEKDKNTVLILKRTLSYLSLVAYMQASGALKQNAITAAEQFCKIYILVDPTNTEAYYLAASVNALNGNSEETFKNLSNAIKNGYADINRFENDTVFYRFKNTAAYSDFDAALKTKVK